MPKCRNYTPSTVAAAVCLMAWLSICALATRFAAAGEADHTKLSTIRVPDGFTIEVVAAPPLVEHPMMACFDPWGRLYVADSAGFNLSAEELLEKLPNRMLRLEDTDGDGRFDRRTVFADQMTFPMGAQWYRGAIYVASPPSIWRLQDTDDDGVADKRKELVSKFGFIGNAADIHGCFLGPDGRIYWCDGRHGHHFESADGQVTSQGQAARIFSCRPDGSNVEVLCGGGMDNPVELAFSPAGDVFGTMTFYNPDDHRHDAIVHYVHGGVYPRKHAVVNEFKRTGDFLPPLCLFETVAPAGLMCYQGPHWPEAMRGNLFSVQFNTHKVLRHPLERDGATWRATTEDFLESSHIDFHPTDVLEDADGSLLVIDTGGWFRHGCPTSQVAKPEVLGAIYRIRWTGASPPADPRGLQLGGDGATSAELAARLGDSRPVVVERAVDALALRGDLAIGPLASIAAQSTHVDARRNAAWALARSEAPAARPPLRSALHDLDPSVRLAALRALGTLRDGESLGEFIRLLSDPEPAIRREAATAAGRLHQPAAVPPLFEAIALGGDRFLEHAILFALIDIADPSATRAGLADNRTEVRRAALVALDQMDDGALERDEVVRLLDTSDFALQQAALEVISRHDGWADQTVELLSAWLAEKNRSNEQTAALRGALVSFAENSAVQQLVGQVLADSQTIAADRRLLLECIARSALEPLPEPWLAGLTTALADPDPALAQAALAVVAQADPPPAIEAVAKLARDEARPAGLRIAALAIITRAEALTPADFNLLLDVAMRDDDALAHLAATRVLGLSRWNDEQLRQLTELVAVAGPLELPALIEAFAPPPGQAASIELGRALVGALQQSPGVTAVPAAQLEQILAPYDDDEVHQFIAQLAAHRASEQLEFAARLAALEPQLAGGDPVRGKAIFAGRKAGCIACHRVDGAGDTIGPDLSKIGAIRAPRDLLESIVVPSSTLARGYETFTVVTRDGQSHTGVVARETTDAIYLRTAQRQELRLPRDTIDELAANPVSIMPQGLDQTLTPVELADLIAYLGSLR